MTAPLLEIRKVTACYGVLPILHGVSIDIHPGEIVALIGGNGAGKTTLMMTIFGRPRANEGRIVFQGNDITDLPTHTIARMGIVQSPEGRRIFSRMTVLENLQMGAITAGDAAGFDRDLERVYELFPLLKARQHQRGGTLSGGEQQMLAIARALMGRPKLLLLDEPSLGLAPLIVKQIFAAIRALNEDGLTVFLVEQSAYHALKLAHRGYVMVNGRITMSGTGSELLGSPEVQAAYLEGGAQGAPQQGARH
jgi:branched-chain amino acid transport system ATP-binding protein